MMSWCQRTSNKRWNNVVFSTLKFTMLKIVESTLPISTLILKTLDNVKTTMLFSTSSFTTLINVETTLCIWPFSKRWKQHKNIFDIQNEKLNWIRWSLSLDYYFKILQRYANKVVLDHFFFGSVRQITYFLSFCPLHTFM